MRKLVVKTMLACAALAVSAPAMAANLIINGNFEGGVDVHGIPVGWSVVPYGIAPGLLTNDTAVLTGADYVNHAGGSGSAAAQANHMLSFGPGNQNNMQVALTNGFDTVAGKVYELSFDYAQFGGTPGQNTLLFSVTGNNGAVTSTLLSGSEAQTGGSNLDTIFAHHEWFFTGTGNPVNVNFTIAGEPTVNVDGLLDNVVVTAVPETSTWGMMILGLGFVGTMLRRRRAQPAHLTA